MSNDSASIPFCPQCFDQQRVTCLSCPIVNCNFYGGKQIVSKCTDCASGQIFLDAGHPKRLFCIKCWRFSKLLGNAKSVKVNLQESCKQCSFQTKLVTATFQDSSMKSYCFRCDLGIVLKEPPKVSREQVMKR